MDRRTFSRALGVVLAASLATVTAACSEEPEAPKGPVTITVNGLPPETNAAQRKTFLDDVKEFEAANPNIKIDAKEGTMDAQTFPARLAGGQLEDVFHVWFTDPANLIAKKQVADISAYTKEFPAFAQLRPDLLKIFSGPDGKVYGVPTEQYTLGLMYNRNLFKAAGLDPDKPPTTWAEVRTAAKAISALGNGTVGYGEYSKNNTGGWHFTAEMYSRGGDVAKKDGDTWKADFNNATGKALLQDLYDMRWTDNSMGEKQLLEWVDLVQMMASGKLGMNVGAPDSIIPMKNSYSGKVEEYGLAPIPGGKNTLAGGAGYMINAKATPEKIRAGLKWLTFKFANPDRIEKAHKTASENKEVVGLPEPNLWGAGDAKTKTEAARKQYGNVPADNYKMFVANPVPLKVEPPNAQAVYAVLDTVMAKVLTDKAANIEALLNDAEKQVNSILATVK
ncbi:sugar ABC transporter substrate-binding protein [Rhizocola hellebori]|uniref:Sugar ABC transporter substrate-binding protein n=1 Tax=Rhizocola hellebori TaxID=1392758 RepID=A0A8J3VEQ2_9ACTN|nr:extracellular solute-binding protein [Rhizocola hellebori]GIH04659.1 sugar ABC transporter substrate-binding protein [Rhizocola hellebori]